MEALRVVIVEDERIVALEMEEYLRRMGAVVCGSVASGEAALEMCRSHRPDVVLMDIMIEGGMNGIEAAVAIRGAIDTAVVFCSAYTGDLRQQAEAINPLGFIEKPMDYGRLSDVLVSVKGSGEC